MLSRRHLVILFFGLGVTLGGLILAPVTVNSQGFSELPITANTDHLQQDLQELRHQIRTISKQLQTRLEAPVVSLPELLAGIPPRYLTPDNGHQARELAAEQWFQEQTYGTETSLLLKIKRVDIDRTRSVIRVLGERQSFLVGGRVCLLDVEACFPMVLLEALDTCELGEQIAVTGRVESFGPRNSTRPGVSHLWMRLSHTELNS